jgi:hypothetical protein
MAIGYTVSLNRRIAPVTLRPTRLHPRHPVPRSVLGPLAVVAAMLVGLVGLARAQPAAPDKPRLLPAAEAGKLPRWRGLNLPDRVNVEAPQGSRHTRPSREETPRVIPDLGLDSERLLVNCRRRIEPPPLEAELYALVVAPVAAGPADSPPQRAGFRGFHFNPELDSDGASSAWLRDYHVHKAAVDRELRELVEKTGANFIDIQVLIPHTLKALKTPPAEDAEDITQWANMAMMENIVAFLDTCYGLGVQVEVDLATNMWVPFSVDTANHIANSPWWPVPDATPWTESRVWYTQIIEYVEANLRSPDAIACWCMMGNHQFGGAEPVLWVTPLRPEINHAAEQFVKNVWPAFRAAGRRPKAAPILLPILANTPFWMDRSTEDRLSAVTNLKRWLVDDLNLPPDYWPISTYVNSDPATDGVHYLGAIVDIIGRDQAHRIISTDFKARDVGLGDTIIDRTAMTDPDAVRWNLQKVDEYGFAGWWMWSYRDTPTLKTGIRDTEGNWYQEVVDVIRNVAQSGE